MVLGAKELIHNLEKGVINNYCDIMCKNYKIGSYTVLWNHRVDSDVNKYLGVNMQNL